MTTRGEFCENPLTIDSRVPRLSTMTVNVNTAYGVATDGQGSASPPIALGSIESS